MRVMTFEMSPDFGPFSRFEAAKITGARLDMSFKMFPVSDVVSLGQRSEKAQFLVLSLVTRGEGFAAGTIISTNDEPLLHMHMLLQRWHSGHGDSVE